MDPVTIGAVLLAIVSGAGGQLGAQLWAGVGALVRRPFRRASPGGAAAALPAGDAELAAFVRAPADERRAVALAEALMARAGADSEFKRALEGWWEQAGPVRAGQGSVSNAISGGTFHGPVIQTQTATGFTFGVPPAPPIPAVPDTETER
jgi:hypothetical protein